MPSRSVLFDLVLPTAIDVGVIAEYHRLSAKIPQARSKYYKVHSRVLAVANLYFDEFEVDRDHVVFLRRQIRMASRGTPAELESISAAGRISNGTEQLYNAESHLLDAAWRLLRRLIHPDTSKENRERFQAAKTAYEFRDLTFIQEMYISLVHERDLNWICSKGLHYVRQELERPAVSLRILQTTPEFEICAEHARNHKARARYLASIRLKQLAILLTAELNHMLTGDQHGRSSKETSEGRSTQEESETGTEGGAEGSNQSTGGKEDYRDYPFTSY